VEVVDGIVVKVEDPGPVIPVPGVVTLVDLGAQQCVPCRMMDPILAELQKEYEGRAAILKIDVYTHRGSTTRFALQAIPTQILYDAQGQERFRHVGFLDKQSIVTELEKLGVRPPAAGAPSP